MDLVKPILMEVLEALGPRTMFSQVAAKLGKTVLLVGSSELCKLKPSNCRALVWLRRFYLANDSLQAAAAISNRDALAGMVKWASSSVIARRSHSDACSMSVHFCAGRNAAA